eukprot:gnl/MRDRNA2_/MRDRNA2_172651_c0_seq1.p1 gnl/MRDRNA2_/MRDRNA2_172651_c0~~gnl/MRDRNA2_/MRDRNA2_172651_c0_seq1.p1  ORF type:complete len:381 (+),score=70.61 gnl/MRDRNA2_/MRDRNA2_172651_c0_seq1:79-1143(+)
MEGYKKRSTSKRPKHAVREELSEIWRLLWYYFWNHCIRGDPWVPFEHVVIALGLIQDAFANDKNHPWRKHFVGFIPGEVDVAAALNEVLDPSVNGKIPVPAEKISLLRAISRHHRFQVCGHREVEYVLCTYGNNRNSCVTELKKLLRKEEKENKKKEVEMRLTQEKPERHEVVERESEDHVENVLSELDVLLAERTDLMDIKGLIVKSPPDEHIRKVFQAFDFYMTGFVDIRFLPEMLGPPPGLGYDLTPSSLQKAVDNHDKDEDQLLTIAEFRGITQDPALTKRYVGVHQDTWDGKIDRMDSKQRMMKDDAVFSSSVSNALGEPLIKSWRQWKQEAENRDASAATAGTIARLD